MLTIIMGLGCSAENARARVRNGLNHWGHADVNIPDSWVIFYVFKFILH